MWASLMDPAYCPTPAMLDVCHKQGAAMVNDGVPALPRHGMALTDRVRSKDRTVFAWGLFSARAGASLRSFSRKRVHRFGASVLHVA